MQQDIMLENLELKDVNPLVCGIEDCSPGHTYGPAVRGYYLLHYVFSGTGMFRCDRGEFKVTTGQIFVVTPGETVSYTADNKTPWEYSWIGFTCTFDISGILGQDVIDASECAHIFRSMASAGHIEAGRELYICGKIYELLALLAAVSMPRHTGAVQYVRMAKNFIESQYYRTISVERMARYLNLNRSYFSKIFRQHTGKSPQQYLVDFRLQKAAELLSAQGLTPGEAARQVGYTDVFNFSRMFSRRYGVPPSRYSQSTVKP